jgi:hypothetical protein
VKKIRKNQEVFSSEARPREGGGGFAVRVKKMRQEKPGGGNPPG